MVSLLQETSAHPIISIPKNKQEDKTKGVHKICHIMMLIELQSSFTKNRQEGTCTLYAERESKTWQSTGLAVRQPALQRSRGNLPVPKLRQTSMTELLVLLINSERVLKQKEKTFKLKNIQNCSNSTTYKCTLNQHQFWDINFKTYTIFAWKRCKEWKHLCQSVINHRF